MESYEKPLTGKSLIIFLVIFSLVFTIAGVVISFVYGKNAKFAMQTTGIIQKIEVEDSMSEDRLLDYYALVNYTVDGVTYENKRLNYYGNYMYVGSAVDVWYDVRNPEVLVTSPVVLKISNIGCYIIGVGCCIAWVILLINKKHQY